MTFEEKFNQKVLEIVGRDRRYKPEAYHFVRQAVFLECKRVKEENPQSERHISGQMLLEALRRLALDQFGPLCLDVLTEWGLSCTEDFGNIVFQLVENQLLGSNEKDSLEDFSDGYDFKEAFLGPFADPDGAPADLPPIA
jgi:uncharacterized repeat protein (TIGR04138 family)